MLIPIPPALLLQFMRTSCGYPERGLLTHVCGVGVHHLADNCWKKCITGKISAGRLESSEEACAANCVERWMDTNMSVLKHLEVLRGQ